MDELVLAQWWRTGSGQNSKKMNSPLSRTGFAELVVVELQVVADRVIGLAEDEDVGAHAGTHAG